MADVQAGKLVKIETRGDVVIASDEAGRKFSTPADRWDGARSSRRARRRKSGGAPSRP